MGKMSLSIDIAAEPEAVFSIVSDIANSADRITWYENIEMLTTGPIGVGSKWRETRNMNNRRSTEEWEITAFQAPEFFSAYCSSQGFDVNYTMRVESEGSGSRLFLDMTTKPQTLVGRLMAPMEWLMAGMMRKIVMKDLQSTKAFIEESIT